MPNTEGSRKGININNPFLGLLFVPLLFLVAAGSIPYGLIANALYEKRARRFARRMAEKGRTITTGQLLDRQAEKSTIIREWKSPFKGPVRAWWTADNLLGDSPFPIVDRREWAPKGNELPFTRWCFTQYIDPSEGKAFLLAASKQEKKIVKEQLGNIQQVEVLTLTTEGW